MMKIGLIPTTRKGAFLAVVLFVGVYIFMESQSELVKHPQYPYYADELEQWPLLGVNLASLGTKEETKCKLPKLKVVNKDVSPFYHPYPAVDCATLFTKRENIKFAGVVAFTVKNGRDLHQLVNLSLSCCYQAFETVAHGHGFGFTRDLGSCQIIRDNVTVIPRGIDYIQVFCKDDNRQILYHDGFPLVNRLLLESASQQIINSQLNIIVIGLDATSRVNFKRFMPLSWKYLLSPDMSAITLHGYSIVGQFTRPNVFAMLSGLSYEELEQQCYRRNGNWNNCPELIWEKAAKRGYITNYAEDMQVFNWYPYGHLTKQPTDYYLWPFTVKMKDNRKMYNESTLKFCLGKRLGFKVFLDFAQSVSQVAQKENRSHFQFVWPSELSHEALNSLGLGDVHLVKALKKFKDTGIVNNTVILVLGDHGNSLSNYFLTPTGSIEYRLPVAHIVLPPWFKTKYPKEYNNFVVNSRKRITPYDIFETMLDIMDLRVPQQQKMVREKGRGISLFKSIPERRYCIEMGIPLEWCIPCHPKIQLNTSSPLVKRAAETVVQNINSLIRNHTSYMCHKLGLHKVVRAHAWHPKDLDMQLCNNMSSSTSFTSLDNGKENVNRVVIVELVLTTNPNATFLSQVKIIWTNSTSFSKLMPVIIETSSDFNVAMRVDWYSETGRCATQVLKPFCICKAPFKIFDLEGWLYNISIDQIYFVAFIFSSVMIFFCIVKCLSFCYRE